MDPVTSFAKLFTKKSTNTLESKPTDVPVEMAERRLYVQCPGCKHVVDVDKMAENLDVCPRCGHHMRLAARRRIELTVDEGTFVEWDADLTSRDFLGFPGYAAKLEKYRAKTGEADAVVCGRAKIGGVDCALFVMNGDFMMGSMGSVVGEKITRCFERAGREGLPVVGFTVSGGARMQEGTTSLMQMAKTSAAVRRFSDAGGLYVAVLTDPTSGGVTASFAMEADVTLAEPGALVAFAGPRVIEQTIHRKLPAGFQSAEFQLKHGFVDQIVPRAELAGYLGRLLALHVNPALLAHEEAPACDAGASKAAAPQAETPAPAKSEAEAESEDAADAPSTAYERVQRARSTKRATSLTLIAGTFDEFVELHGDRRYADDPAVVGGIARLGDMAVTVIGTERGTSIKDRVERNFGSAHPEGYRKALRLMRQAEKFGRPVVCLIDTSGAYCGIEAEERGQGQAIAENLVEMAGLTVPVVSIVIGEGGSGGALALGVANQVWMLEDAVYSVISPEGCASILYKDASKAADAAAALRLTAHDLAELGIVDRIVPEHDGDVRALTAELAEALAGELGRMGALAGSELAEQRYEKFRAIGVTQ